MKEYTPIQYLKIDVATNFGDADVYNDGQIHDLDKVNFEDRIAWFDRQEENGQLVQIIDQADKPALYYAGLQAYDKAMQGQPIGYPISLDACSSGLQILSALANCAKSALRCGVISTGNREDAYMSLFQDMNNAATGIRMNATRSDLKQAVMTSLYGSKAQPRKLFGDGTPALDLFYKTMETEIPGAWELNLALKGLWQPYATEHEWVMPDNFHVSMKVEDLETDEVVFLGDAVEVYTKQAKGSATGLSLSPNVVHSIDGMMVREITRRCTYDQKHVDHLKELCKFMLQRTSKNRKVLMGRGRQKDLLLTKIWKRCLKSGFLSARIIDLVDEKNIGIVSIAMLKNMLDNLPKKSFPVLSIHDCFRVHPNYANDLRRQYNIILAELAGSEILSDIATQITGKRQQLQKLGDIAADIRKADYALS